MSKNDCRSFYVKTLGWCGNISEVFHTSIIELLNMPITQIYEIFPVVVKGRQDLLRATNGAR